MTASERLQRWNTARHQTTADVEARYNAQPSQQAGRTPLTASQHILHLLLTVLTGGLWGIVWIIRATQGNKAPAAQRPSAASTSAR